MTQMHSKYAKELQDELNQEFDAMTISMAAVAAEAEMHGASNVLSVFLQCHAQGMTFEEALQSVIEQSSEAHHQTKQLVEQAKQTLTLYFNHDSSNDTMN